MSPNSSTLFAFMCLSLPSTHPNLSCSHLIFSATITLNPKLLLELLNHIIPSTKFFSRICSHCLAHQQQPVQALQQHSQPHPCLHKQKIVSNVAQVSSCEKGEQFNLSLSVPSLERTVPLFNYHRFIAFFLQWKIQVWKAGTESCVKAW